MNDLTWSCQSCKKVRPDKNISVLSYPWKDSEGKIIEGGEINFRYCNDQPGCLVIAREHAKKGSFN